MTTDFNVSPYYDDFDDSKNYYRILFKPSVSVQSRELIQLQTVIQDQIKKFGDHIFRHGSVVIPGNSNSDLSVPYVKLKTTTADVTAMEGQTITSTTGVTAVIRKGLAATATDPATLYLGYNSGGTNGESTFLDDEALTIGATTVEAIEAEATGLAAMAFINKGVYYINGFFVGVDKQSIVISKYSDEPSCHVLLKITESIVDSDDDQTLLDPAQGSYNYAAPGADRFNIELTLETLPLGSEITQDYVEIMRFNEGVLEEHARYPKYNELEKSLARRTYEESGDYVVDGLEVSTREHLRSEFNGGAFDASSGGSADKYAIDITRGKAYIRGYENELISNRILAADKGRTANHIKSRSGISMIPNFGQYLYVNSITGMPNFRDREVINLQDRSSGGANIGTAIVVGIDLHETNTTDSNAIYRLYLTQVVMNAGQTIQGVGRATWSTGGATVLHKLTVPVSGADFVLNEVVTGNSSRVATVAKWTRATSTLYVFRHTATAIPIVGDRINAPSTATGVISAFESAGNLVGNASIVELPLSSVNRVRTATDTVDFTYKVFKELTITTSAGGTGSTSVTGMTIDPKEVGNMLITSSTGVQSLSIATVSPDGLSISVSGAPVSTTLYLIVSATKTNQPNRTKTYTASFVQSGITPASTITLEKADIISLKSIISTLEGDVTNRFTLDDGQRDYAYLRGSVSLIGGMALPTGTLSITYDYFEHSGSGDYFSVDSYETSGLPNYYDNIKTYTSKTDGKVFDLRNCLDFRPRVGTNGQFTGTGNSRIDSVQPESRITTSAKYYVGRQDIVVMDKSGLVSVVSGVPEDSPRAPIVPSESLLLATITVPAYTRFIREVTVKRARNQGYTMAEVAQIEDRLHNLEQYTLLTQTENALINNDIIDASTGLSRFKSGYLVDSFEDPDSISDIFDEEFTVTYKGEEIIPLLEVNELDLEIVTGSTTARLDQLITLPFTEEVFASQMLSSRITNVNPFAVYTWTGTMTLTPRADSWVEVENLPAIFNSTSETVTVNRPWNWQPPAGSLVRRAGQAFPVWV